jgi:hypothetical protein
VTKKDDAARNEAIEADRARETWDSEGGRAATLPDEEDAGKPTRPHGPPGSRRIAERHREDRRG